MRKLLLLSFLIMLNCTDSQELPEGTWTGVLTPMNHPEMETPMKYTVAYQEGALAIDIFMPDGSTVKTRDIELTSDTLFYTFNEPEGGFELNCALAKVQDHNFEGRCADDTGKWALFTMIPPQN